MSPLSTDEVSRKIRDFVSEPNAVCFAGAGVGARAGLPTWHRYLEGLAVAAERYDPELATVMRSRIASNRLPEAAEFFKLADMPDGVKYDELKAPFASNKYDHKALKALASLPFTAFVTTNYDRAIHDAWADVRGRTLVCAELGDSTLSRAIHWTDVYIARIHGRAELPASMVLSSSDYRRLLEDREYEDFLVHVLENQRCLFVGFSFMDPALRAVLSFYKTKLGPDFPSRHLALIPSGAASLQSELASFNIETATYEPDALEGSRGHPSVWAAIAKAARSVRGPNATQRPAPFPAALEDARSLFLSAYVHRSFGTELLPMRTRVVEGLILGIVSDQAEGMSKAQVVVRLREHIRLSVEEAQGVVDEALAQLLVAGRCHMSGDRIVAEPQEQTLDRDLARLTSGAQARLKVREGASFDMATPGRHVLEEVLLMRGWDIGAHFAGVNVSGSVNVRVLEEAVERHCVAVSRFHRSQIVAAIHHLLTRPDDEEAAILSDFGRLAFAVDMVLQHGRSALLHPSTLPVKVYLDASVLMPALVNGHPLRPVYADAIRRWRTAATSAGLRPQVFVAEEFLEEIIRHRELGIASVERSNLEDPEALSKYVLFYGADKVNVFVGAYASWVGRFKSDIAFRPWLAEHAPYDNVAALRRYLSNAEFQTVGLTITAGQDERLLYRAMAAELEDAYDAMHDRHPKPAVLIRHEAAQLARIASDLRRSARSVFVSADYRLRRAATGPVLGEAGASILSHVGFVALVDFLVGLEPEPRSLTRLMWGVRLVDEDGGHRSSLRAYFTDRALQRYDAAAMLALSEVIDRVLDDAVGAAQREDLNFNSLEDQARVATFLDRFEVGFFETMDAAMARERRRP